MARSRNELDAILRTLLGSSNLYFDPPETFKMNYPCIVYSDAGDNNRFADNSKYIGLKRYTLIYITKNADDPMVDRISDLRYCRRAAPYIADNLRHHPYTIYF